MASILKVDEMQGVTSAGDITITGEGGSATMQLQQGVAKAWCSLNGTGTIAVRDSFNTSSITDHSQGVHSVNLQSSMANDTYVPTGSVIGTSSDNYYSYVTSDGSNAHLATGSLRFHIMHYGGTSNDLSRVHVCINGDLA